MNFEKYNFHRHKPLLGKRKIILYNDHGSPLDHLLNRINLNKIQKIPYLFYLWGGGHLEWRSG